MNHPSIALPNKSPGEKEEDPKLISTQEDEDEEHEEEEEEEEEVRG